MTSTPFAEFTRFARFIPSCRKTPERPENLKNLDNPEGLGQGLRSQACDVERLLTLTVTHPAPGRAVIRAVGEIDRLTAPDWARVLSETTAHLSAPSGTNDRPAPHLPGPRGHTPAGPPTSVALTWPREPREPDGPPRLTCDLTGVGFFGVAGVNVLVQAIEQSDDLGVDLRLAMGRAVRRPLELIARDGALPVHPDLDSVTR